MEQNLYFPGATDLVCTPLGNICKGQDGAIYNGLLFRFGSKGTCRVYDLKTLAEVGAFTLDRVELLMPHSNSVFFGNFYCVTDEFPLLYTNLYNNYANAENRLEGVCCVYRIFRREGTFSSQLVQLLQVDFAHTELWQSADRRDARPYGNFVADLQKHHLYAFTMRDSDHTTRFFRFPLPEVTEGELTEPRNVPTVRLRACDIQDQFDTDYVNYMQGAVYHKSFIYSLEGFTPPDERGTPKIRVFDTKNKCQVFEKSFLDYAMPNEPEWIAVYEDKIYYVNHNGDVYTLTFRGEKQ